MSRVEFELTSECSKPATDGLIFNRVTTNPDIWVKPSSTLLSRFPKVDWLKGLTQMPEFFVGEIQPGFLNCLSNSRFRQITPNAREVSIQEVKHLGIDNASFMLGIGLLTNKFGQQSYKLEAINCSMQPV